jgi:hypothetical protein
MPPAIHVRVTVFQPLRAPEELRAETEMIVRDGGAEPLHHDLFREAWNQRDANPRSALVTGITAAELAVKRCISTLIPSGEWLATNVPSPPLIQILKEYLPILPVRCHISGVAKAPPQQLLDTLRKGVTIRNRLSHAGGASPSTEDVENILEAVRDLLWLTDYYSGVPWAFGYISDVTRAQLS